MVNDGYHSNDTPCGWHPPPDDRATTTSVDGGSALGGTADVGNVDVADHAGGNRTGKSVWGPGLLAAVGVMLAVGVVGFNLAAPAPPPQPGRQSHNNANSSAKQQSQNINREEESEIWPLVPTQP
jgi:hypothetical protein